MPETKLPVERFGMDWRRLFFLGALIIIVGIMLVSASLFNSNVMLMFASHLSWLPLSGLIFLGLGLLECLDAFVTKDAREFQQNVQVGILDSVVGAMMFLSVADELSRYSMLLAAFLMVRGLVRIILVHKLKLPYLLSTTLLGVISIAMGIMIWQQWPFTEGWFVALCINVEICFRGWSMMMFALLVRKQKQSG
jgi:uncharacterized membrane protein HdeD (DUF308 family)